MQSMFVAIYHYSLGPTTQLGATCAPLDHYFILEIFLESFNTSFKKTLKVLKVFLNTIMLRCLLKIIPKYVIKKYFQIVLLVSNLLLNYFM
jgi:hypothetical protein